MIPKEARFCLVRGQDRNEAVAYVLGKLVHEELVSQGHDSTLITSPLSEVPHSIIKGGNVTYDDVDERKTGMVHSLLAQYPSPHGVVALFHNGGFEELEAQSLWGECILEIPAVYKPMRNRRLLETARDIYCPGESIDHLMRVIQAEDDEYDRRSWDDDNFSTFSEYFAQVTDTRATWAKYDKEKMVREIVDVLDGWISEALEFHQNA
jgi:hypothetical protein